MRFLRRLGTRAGNFARGRRGDKRLREEMEVHLALLTADNLRAGMTAGEARRQAMLTFGGMAAVGQDYRAEKGLPAIENLLQDVGYAARLLAKAPGFTAVAILTMALGIGATTAIYSVVDATLLHPLPYWRPEQLVSIADDLPGAGSKDVGMSTLEWMDFERSGIFEYVSPAWFDDNNLTGGSQPIRVGLSTVAPNYFALLGVKPQMGRTFNPADPTPGYNLEVVISDGLWKRAFGGDPRILDRNVRLDTDLYQIVGVMPPGFRAPGRTREERNIEVWAACGFAAAPAADPPRRDNHLPGVIARLKPGATVAAAQSEVDALVASLTKQYPIDYPAQSGWTVRLTPLQESVAGNVRQSLYLLLGAVGLVLLIGCVNVANLVLARASARGREMAIRQALGAGRTRLTQQVLTESFFLSLLGGAAGLAILFLTKPILMGLVPDSLPRLNEISISWGVLLIAMGASAAAGAIFGLAPALHARRLELTQMLKREGRGSTGSGQQARTRRVLVVTEFALSVVLMIGASLLLRSFRDLLNVQLGFNPQSVMMIRTRLPYPNDPGTDRYATAAQEAPFVRELLRRSKALPGVEEAALGNSTSVPLDHHQRDQNVLRLIFEGRGMQSSEAPMVDGSIVTPEYFHLMAMTLTRGRSFTDFDNEKAPLAAVINEAMAQTYWPNEDPLGKRLKLSPRATAWTTVVGVVADTRTASLEDARIPQIYASLYQQRAKHLAIFLRGHLDTAAVPEAVRRQVHSVDGTLPVFGAETLNETVSASLAERRFSMEMVGLFALTALLLSGLGIYGVISYMVSERTREIGIRLALGAQSGNILDMVLQQGMGLAIAGAAAGLAGGWVVSHLMSGLLYGVRPGDPVTFAGVTVVLAAVALAACYIPARRAMRVDALTALRYE